MMPQYFSVSSIFVYSYYALASLAGQKREPLR